MIGSFSARPDRSDAGNPDHLIIHLPCGRRLETSRMARCAIRFFKWAKAVAGRLTMRCVFRGRPLESDMRDESPSRMSGARGIRSSSTILGRLIRGHQADYAARRYTRGAT